MSTKSKKEKQYPKSLHHSLWQKWHRRTLHLPGWHFDSTIKPYLIEIERKTIWDVNHVDIESKTAILYGLRAERTDTKEALCSAFFIRYENGLHQVNNMAEAQEHYELLKKFWVHDAQTKEYWKWHKETHPEEYDNEDEDEGETVS